MSRPPSPQKQALDELAELCRMSRNKRKYTQGQLAERAHLSAGRINTLESATKLRAAIKQAKDEMAWPVIVTQVALALGAEPQLWLKILQGANPFNVPTEEIVRRAQQKFDARRRRGGQLARVRYELNHNKRCEVRVFLLTCDYDQKEDKAQRTFYEKFAKLILGTISPQIEVQVVKAQGYDNFRKIMEGLSPKSKVDPDYHLLIGPWSMISRSQYEATFTRLPCFWHRLACLALPDSAALHKDSWQTIRDLRLNGGYGPRVVTIEDEAGDVYLRSYCSYKENTLERQPKYNTQAIAHRLHEIATSNERSAVLVIGEFEARSVISHYRRHYNRRGLVDLAADATAYAPSYPLAIATNERDRPWTRTISQAIDELFLNAPDLIVQTYGEYLDSVLRETIDLNENRHAREVVTELFFSDRLVPAYLELRAPEESLLSKEFRAGLQKELERRMRKLVEDKGLCDNGQSIEDKAAQLIEKMAPWLAENKTLDEIRSAIGGIEKRLAQLEGARPMIPVSGDGPLDDIGIS